jgi:hypothetical protein
VHADEVVDTLEARDDALQCAITCIAIGFPVIKFLHSPGGGAGTILDRYDDNL